MKANEAKSKFVYPDKLYARTNDNITLDISYAPQTLEAVEYIRADVFIHKIQTELDKLYHNWFDDSTGLEVSEEAAELGALDMAYEAFQKIIDNLREQETIV